MVKPKHSKILKKRRARRDADKKKHEPEIDFDTSAYVIYNRLEMTYPCLSFDIVKEERPRDVTDYPLSLHMIAGAQTPAHVENNYVYVIKIDNVKPLKQENENEEDQEESEGEEEDPKNLPNLTQVRVPHKGCVNRIRANKLGGKLYTATWSDTGKVHIYDLTTSIQAVGDHRSMKTYTAQKVEPKPLFTFGGHFSEGYAMDWNPIRPGTLATGDCKKNIHIWTMRTGDWNVNQQPLLGHENSVEDINWSPDDEHVLASCSVDKSIRLWDLRLPATAKCIAHIPNSHNSDVNVIDWNTKCTNFLVSGGDDGVVKVWDTRLIHKTDQSAFSVAQFDYHRKPITSLEWSPHDDTVIAVCSDDNRLTLWDLAVEKDEEQENADAMDIDESKKNESSESSSEESSSESANGDEEHGEMDQVEEQNEGDDEEHDDEEQIEDEGVEYGDLDMKKIPEQMLFLHQGQVEIKELHWHPQLSGLLISTALNGVNIFKTISA